MKNNNQDEESDALRAPHILHKVAKESSPIELREDGEDRFREAVRAAAKSGPKHRPSKA